MAAINDPIVAELTAAGISAAEAVRIADTLVVQDPVTELMTGAQGRVIPTAGHLQRAGTFTFTGSVVNSGSVVEIPGSAITVPAGYFQVGDGVEVSFHWEVGGTTATNRVFSVTLQPAADAGSANNVSDFGTIFDNTAVPKDGSSLWLCTVLAGGIKRSAVGNGAGLGPNTTTFPPATFNPNIAYRVFARVSELATASNSITAYRITLARRR